MYCPILCINPNNTMISFGQCVKEACAWWIADGENGKCAICQMGEYAANH